MNAPRGRNEGRVTIVEYVGLDVSKEETAYCVKGSDGKVLARGKAASDPQALFEALREHCLYPERIVVETGTLSHWLVRGLRERGLRVDLIDARQAHGVMKLQHNKTDANDAGLLAEIARTGFCRPSAPGCLLARMSGSGATCFGLFEDDAAAQREADALAARNPRWWVRAGRTLADSAERDGLNT